MSSLKDNFKLQNIVAFCSLMQNGGGILDKSPAYILEKFKRYCESDRDETAWGLDSDRREIVSQWRVRWIK